MSGSPPPDGPEDSLAALPSRTRATRSAPAPFAELPEHLGAGTVAVHAGRLRDRNAGSVVTPIYQTTTFHFPAEFSEAVDPAERLIYTRYGNPSQSAAAEVLRELEGGQAARVFSSGMAAISTSLLAVLRSGDCIVASEEIYGGTRSLLENVLPRWGIEVRWVPHEVGDPTERAVGRVRVLYLETPTNPRLRVLDIGRWARAADALGAMLVVDNTFATPINQRPLDAGADLVVHSASKYLAGHSDVIAGGVVGATAILDRIAPLQRDLGGSLDPFAAFLLQRGMKTLGVRVARQNETARRVVAALRDHPAVAAVHAPGSASPEEEAIAGRQMRGRGGMVTFELRGGGVAVARFLHRLRLVQVASSLGSVESLVSVPAETSHAHLRPVDRARLGVHPGMVRLSCGIEETDDLVNDLCRALDA